MGRPSEKIRSAQRPGKRQRARLKNFRPCVYHGVSGGTICVKYGRKKTPRVMSWIMRSPSIGEPVKSESELAS